MLAEARGEMSAIARPMVHFRRRAASVGAALAAGAVFLWLVYVGLTWDLRRSATEPAAEFRVVKVVRQDLSETVAATGTMESVTRVEIKSEVPGVIRKIFVEEGDRVALEQPLFELDLDRLGDRVAELRAAVDVRKAAALQDVEARAAADFEQVRREHDRTMRLFGQGIASAQDRDDALHKLRLAEIAVSDAHAERAARTAGVAQAQAALQKAERDLERGTLRAPIAGVVIQRPAELGAPVADMSASNGGTLLAVVADDLKLRLVAQVDENDIARVRVGQTADVTLDAFPGERFQGTVRKVSSAGTLDQKVANFEVEIGLPRDERIRVGMSADARVVVGEHRDVLVVPNTAIIRGADGPHVRRGPIDAAQVVSIRELYSDGFSTVVDDGLAEGDPVLVRSSGAEP
jgi:HlyD family secretion protein